MLELSLCGPSPLTNAQGRGSAARAFAKIVTADGSAASFTFASKSEQAIVQLGSMLKGLIGAASKKHLKLAPFIGIAE